MKGIDTNILVYAHHARNVRYPVASKLLQELAEGQAPWAIPWPCLYEYLRVVTHPALTEAPLSASEAWRGIEGLLLSSSLILLMETERHSQVLASLLRQTDISGNLVHDAHIAALLIEHGVKEIITADDDFRRFRELTVINPFLGG